jgi:hypothetical protein
MEFKAVTEDFRAGLKAARNGNNNSGQKPTLLDRRFDRLVGEIRGQAAKTPDGAFSVRGFNGVVIKGRLIGTLDHFLDIEVEGEILNLVAELGNKAEFAVRGWLGANLVPMGQRCLQAVKERLAREEARARKGAAQEKQLLRLWRKELLPAARKLPKNISCRPKMAAAIQALLGWSQDGPIPEAQKEARRAGFKAQFLTEEEWAEIRKAALRLRKLMK